MKLVLGNMRRTDADFGLIQPGDRVAVGCSGGKDSTLLLYAMKLYQYFSPNPFSLCGIMLDMGWGCDPSPLVDFCHQENIPLHVVPTDIKQVVFDIKKETNPCALCAKLRRGALYRTAKFLGCNKVAFGHHADDALETLMLSLFYEGRIHTFSPISYLDRADVTLIRPLLYTPEHHIISTVQKKGLPVIHNPCPANGVTQRQHMKELLRKLNREIPGVPDKMLGALRNVPQYNLWEAPYRAQRERLGLD